MLLVIIFWRFVFFFITNYLHTCLLSKCVSSNLLVLFLLAIPCIFVVVAAVVVVVVVAVVAVIVIVVAAAATAVSVFPFRILLRLQLCSRD